MFGADNVQSVTFTITDPGATAQGVHLWRAPAACEILRGYLVCQDAQGAGSAGAFELQNWGSGGTSVGGTVFASKGGTASADRLSAETPYALTLSEGTMAAGEWLVCKYTEAGDWVETQVHVTIDYVLGVGA